MIYLNNTTNPQRVYIPRDGYLPGAGDTGEYSAGQNINISKSKVISVTGLTEAIESTVTAMTLDYATTGDVQTMIESATGDFVTSGDVHTQIEEETSNFVTSGDVETIISGFTTSGEVETMISSATSGMATTQDVENALTSYTPTANFATINGSGITNGGDIVIQGGGDSTVLEKITELPAEPQDGATYNYNGVLMKYVNGEGKWGYWVNLESLMCFSSQQMGSATLFYAVIPNSMDGQLAFGLGWIKNTSADTNVQIWGYFNLQENTIDVYNNKDKTGSTLYRITKNATGETYINSSSNKMYVSWKDNVIQLRGGDTSTQLLRHCDPTISGGHYELMQELPYNYPITRSSIVPTSFGSGSLGYAALFDVNSGRVSPGAKLDSRTVYFNNSGYSNALTYFGTGKPTPDHFFAPTASGATGSLCVSTGDSAPVWKTIVEALGVDFWTGTQDEYDALASHSSTTLYFIKQS